MVALPSLLVLLLAARPVVSATSPKSFEQIAQQADGARTRDQLNEAIALYREGLRLRPTWSEGWWELGSLLYDQDQFPEAQSAFRRFAAITSKPGPAYAFLGLCEYETRDYDRALQHFRLWARSGWAGTPELVDVASFHFALLLTRQGQFIQALYLFAAEAGKLRTSPSLAEAMGLASLRIASLPEDYPPEQREMVWLAGAAMMAASERPQRFASADEYSLRLLQHYSQSPNVHYLRGTLLGFEYKNNEAAKEFQQELQVSPDHVPAMLELALIDLADEPKDEALNLAKRAVTLEPKNSRAHYALGRALLVMGHFQESTQELETAKRLAPENSAVRFQLATAYRKLGRTAEAKREQTAFELLRDKQDVLAPPEEKTKVLEKVGRPQ